MYLGNITVNTILSIFNLYHIHHTYFLNMKFHMHKVSRKIRKQDE